MDMRWGSGLRWPAAGQGVRRSDREADSRQERHTLCQRSGFPSRRLSVYLSPCIFWGPSSVHLSSAPSAGRSGMSGPSTKRCTSRKTLTPPNPFRAGRVWMMVRGLEKSLPNRPPLPQSRVRSLFQVCRRPPCSRHDSSLNLTKRHLAICGKTWSLTSSPCPMLKLALCARLPQSAESNGYMRRGCA